MPDPYQLWIPFKTNEMQPEERLKSELHQNWAELENWANNLQQGLSSGLSDLDAIVDPDLTTEDPSTNHYLTVGNAIRGLKAAAGGTFATNRTLNIGVTGRFTSARATETATIIDADCPARVNLIGLGSPFLPFVGAPIIEWSDGGFNIGGLAWTVTNIRLVTTKTTQFFTSSPAVTMHNAATVFTSSLAYVTSGSLTAESCSFENTKFNNNSTTTTILQDSHLLFPNSGTTTILDNSNGGGRFYMWGGSVDPGATSKILTVNAQAVSFVGVLFGTGFTGGTAIPTLQFGGGANQCVVVMAGGALSTSGAQPSPAITASGTPGQFILIGSFGSITLPAPGSGRVTGSGHVIEGEVFGPLDVTGPAKINAMVSDVVTLRGKYVNFMGVATVPSSSGTAITGSATLTDSIINASVVQIAAVSTQQAFNFVAGSARNIANIAGASLFTGTASVPGTTTIVTT